MPPGVPIKRRNEKEDGGEAEGVENHHAVDLDGSGEAGRKFGADQRSEQCGVEELQRIDAEEDQTEQRGVEKNSPAVAETIAAEENVVREPNIDEHQEAESGSSEGWSGRAKVGEASGNGERDDEENESDTQDDVAENVEAGDGDAAEAEIFE